MSFEMLKANLEGWRARLHADMKNATGMAKAFMRLDELAIGIGIFLLVAAIIIGKNALPIFFQTCTSGWDPTTVTVWIVLPIVGVAVLVIGVIKTIQEGHHGY